MLKASVHIYLDPALLDELKTEAARLGLSMSAYASLVLADIVDRRNPQRPTTTTKAARKRR